MESMFKNPQAPGQAPANQSQRPNPDAKAPYTVLAAVLLAAMILALGYSFYEAHRFQMATAAGLMRLSGEIQAVDTNRQAGERRIAEIESQLTDALKSVKGNRQDFARQARQFQLESRRTRTELQSAIGNKADAAQVEALKAESNSKFDSVSSEVGGVKTEVGSVKTDLASTRHDLEGTQRQLMDVRETLTAAVARNATELASLRAKGERDYFEFSIPKKNLNTKVGDIALVLTKTDPKKKKYSVKIVADDNQLEKNDRTVNEPVQFLVGHNLVRYEVVVNWVQKDRVGGYLSVPKDKAQAAEGIQTAKSF